MTAASVSDSVGPLLEAVQINRTDIVKTLLEQVDKLIPHNPEIPNLRAFLDEPRNDRGNLLQNAVQVRI